MGEYLFYIVLVNAWLSITEGAVDTLLFVYLQDIDYRIFFLNSWAVQAKKVICEVNANSCVL